MTISCQNCDKSDKLFDDFIFRRVNYMYKMAESKGFEPSEA